MPVTLAYWKARGLAQPIRYLLKHTKTEFEDVVYELGDGPEFSPEQWTSVKFTLGLDLPNIPYLIDGDLKITQSNAILRHIATKHDMCGKTIIEKTRVNMMENEAMDFRNGFVGVCYDSNYSEKLKSEYITKVKDKLAAFSKFIGSNPWFAGNEITFVDFPMYELLDQHRLFQLDILDGFDNLKAFLERFESLPAIKEYKAATPLYPVNNKHAAWGSK